MNIDLLERILQQSIGSSAVISSSEAVGGGCINQCYRLVTGGSTFFIKCNERAYLDMFEKESKGLIALTSYGDLLVPQPINTGTLDHSSYLLMEFIQSSSRAGNYWERLGEGLADMHQQTKDQFGWDTDNYIGRLPQSNRWRQRWTSFFVRERLNPQIDMAVNSGVMPSDVQSDLIELCSKIDQYLIIEVPAFLHGDLWSGNIMTGPTGEPCLVDPAVYFGHREVELAFTTLFGGFDQKFYQAYNLAYPLTSGYQERFDIYNLYPLLVHLNLFGAGYLGSIRQVLEKYL